MHTVRKNTTSALEKELPENLSMNTDCYNLGAPGWRRRVRPEEWGWKTPEFSTLPVAGGGDGQGSTMCSVAWEPRPLLGRGRMPRGDLSTEPLLLLCARASGFSWPAPVHASSCSKRRKRRATGKQPSLTVSASEPITPPDPVLRLPALGTADASHGQAALTGPLSASSQLRVHI